MGLLDRLSAGLKAFSAPTKHMDVDAFGGSLGGGNPYEGASYGRRTIGMGASNGSVNTLLFSAGETLRARSRDIVRKNGWASNGSETWSSELIGTGIKPQSQHPSPAKKAFLQQLWLDWTDVCDASGIQEFYGLQGLITQSVVEGGECFVRLRYRQPDDDLIVPLQLQALEAEHCPITKNEMLANGNVIRYGIEFNQIGKRVAYWLYPVHPGEFPQMATEQANGFMPVRVPASQIIHIFKPVRPGQVRGEPWMSRALIRLFDYDQYTDAEVVRKKVAALFAGFITETDPADPLPGNSSSTLPADWGFNGLPPTNDGSVEFAGLEPGTMNKLNPGEDVKFSQPADVGPGFEAFNRAALREIAAAIGVTYEQLTGDLSGVNYSSIRAGLLAFRRKCQKLQQSMIVFQFCRPVWNAWLESAVFAGQIRATDYNRNRADYRRVAWIAPGWQSVDPSKDLAASKDAIRCGLTSRRQVVSENGYDVEDIDRENMQDQERADEMGLVYDTDARQTSATGMRPGAHDPNNPDGLEDPEADPETAPVPADEPKPGSQLVQ
jgi:lambda family phage portal protein